MFCRHCGSQIPDNTVLCPNCGAPVEPPEPQQSRPEPYQQPVQERPIDQQSQQPQQQRPIS
ncbi:MAG: zinc ribbon domain-containing protein, partial [Firmicutes bacterium]|nr:zinc ribbon domain-containing protein [Bacillota bacterium]